MRFFRCSGDVPESDDRIDHNMLKILRVLDGPKSMASIAFACGMNMGDFQRTIKVLIELDLIRPAEASETMAE